MVLRPSSKSHFVVLANVSKAGATTTGFRPRSSPSLFTPTWTPDPSNTLVPLPDAPPFTYEPGRGFVVTGTTPRPRPIIVSTLPTTTTKPLEWPSAVNTTGATVTRFGTGSEVGPVYGPTGLETTKPVEETPRFLPTTQRIGSIDVGFDPSSNRSQVGSENEGRGFGSNASPNRDRDRAIDVAQVGDNSFSDEALGSSSSSLRPSSKVGVELVDGSIVQTSTLLNGIDEQNKLSTTSTGPTSSRPSSDGAPTTERSQGSRPPSDISSTDTSSGATLDGGPTTLRPDPSPRIGTATEIFVNGTEVFPAYTIFGEPCKGQRSIPN